MAASDERTILALHRAGWTVEQIVTEARVKPAMVAKALGAGGHVPAAWTARTVSQALAWSQWRRSGEPVAGIAAAVGVSHQWVSKLTQPFGPYLPPRSVPNELVTQWVQARQGGETAASIGRRFGVTPRQVLAATAEHGPFDYPNRDGGRIATAGIARMFGVALPVLGRWQARADFPQPVVEDGRRMWDEAEVRAWATQRLTRCPVCAAQALDVNRHRGARRH